MDIRIDVYVFFYRIGKFILYDKNPPGDRTAAVRLDVAEATQSRRRIPHAGFFLVQTLFHTKIFEKIYHLHNFYKSPCYP